MNLIENKATYRAGDGTNSHAEGHNKVDYRETMVCSLCFLSYGFI